MHFCAILCSEVKVLRRWYLHADTHAVVFAAMKRRTSGADYKLASLAARVMLAHRRNNPGVQGFRMPASALHV